MAELIEKVAMLAGWERITSMLNPKRFTWVERVDGIKPDFATEEGLNADGLRILLDELLRAGFAIIGTYEIHQVSPFGEGVDPIEVREDTLEEAVMLAYCTMKEGSGV